MWNRRTTLPPSRPWPCLPRRRVAVMLALALGMPMALAEAPAPQATEPSPGLEALQAELASARQAADAAAARAAKELDGLQKDLAGIKAKLAQTLADAQAKSDNVANLERTRADLEAQLAAARKETDAARSAVEKAQADISAKAAVIATLEQGRAELQAAIEVERTKLAAAEKAASERLAAAENAAADKLAATERKLKAESEARWVAEGQLADLTKKLAAAESHAAALDKERGAVAAKLAAALDKIPVRDGGSRTPALARARAADASTAFVAASDQARRQPSDATRAALRDAGTVLQQAQYEVAVAIDARGVYRLREEDTLGMVAGRFYGTGNKWPAIYEANQHVLADPDRMLPGMTLVVP